jgi:hypothetical protein
MTVPTPNPQYAVIAGTEGMRTDDGDGTGSGGDHFSHAAGRICRNCDRRIEARQPARRKGEDGWVHDVCPPEMDW